jgi:hypothetical protein
MAEPEVEATWRVEFKRIHETSPGNRAALDGANAAFRWSGDEAEVRRLEDEHTVHVAKWDTGHSAGAARMRAHPNLVRGRPAG